MKDLERRLQVLLEGVYRIDGGLDVADFRVDRATLKPVVALSDGTREALLVQSDAQETFLALFIDEDILARARTFFRAPGEDDGQVRRQLDAACVATEGVSHFVYFTFCGERQDRSVSQVELELQAEIDKFLLLRIVCGLGGSSLRTALFDDFELDPSLSAEDRLRYRIANRNARRYAAWLERSVVRGQVPDALRDARALYRKPLAEKLEHIERRAA